MAKNVSTGGRRRPKNVAAAAPTPSDLFGRRARRSAPLIAPLIEQHFGNLNADQRAIVGRIDGPLLVVAGPGSGKTYSIVLRTLNLLLLERAVPAEIVLCTFTEKAAFEMRDRLSAAAQKVAYRRDLSELRVSTIHGLCNRLLIQHRHRSDLGHNFETLDDLTQLLFIFERFREIVGEQVNGKYLGRWSSRWQAIEGVRGYFDKVADELIDATTMVASGEPFLYALGTAYLAYRRALADSNRIDFAHLQYKVHHLLHDLEVGSAITSGIRYVLVDEYQDTNYVQEQLLLKLSERTSNLCVVGDEDQSLYRFRGATVRNILEFPTRFANCTVLKLETNYRSHRRIVDAYDRWMASADWSNRDGMPFRNDKRIVADDAAAHPDYPSLFAIRGRDGQDEARRFAEMVKFLKGQNVIADYNQVALLLHSVRDEHSESYIAALTAEGIPAYCPRARGYFDAEEVAYLVACYAVIFGWVGDRRGEVAGSVAGLAEYADASLRRLAENHAGGPLTAALASWVGAIEALEERESLDLRPADYFYRLLALEPFSIAVRDENRARRLAIFSQLLNVFQTYYHYTVITHGNRDIIRFHLFNSFLRLLHDGGINEYEDPDQPFPKGYVQIMTIHQSKGLEFPVVVVGSLATQLSTAKRIDRDLAPFYSRPLYEPSARITHFDRMRLHYVAFSRPQKVLVLTAHEAPKPYFAPIVQGLPQWPYVQQDLLGAQRFEVHARMKPKRTYSFTGDLKVYETCPRQYQFYRSYDFTPSRSAVIFFGLLVHQAIEEIHRLVLDGRIAYLNEPLIRDLFERTFRFLCLSDVRPIGDTAKEGAFRQVMNYFRQNQSEMLRVIQTEVDVSIEKEGYILGGKVDLLLGTDGRLELLDFKTSERSDDPRFLSTYEDQLCTYAHILEHRYSKRVERLWLYWTAETDKARALMEFPYRPEKVAEAGRRFDAVVARIEARDFRIVNRPENKVCKECDLKHYCLSDGTLKGGRDVFGD